MAVLKECLLNNPSEGSLQNLKEFCVAQSLDFDVDGYRPLLKKQIELADRNAYFKECDEHYKKECEFIDQLRPMEFAEAKEAEMNGGAQTALTRTLEGISRLYSDAAIECALQELVPTYPKAKDLLEEYRQLAETCENSEADEKSLEALKKQKDAWLDHLLTVER